MVTHGDIDYRIKRYMNVKSVSDINVIEVFDEVMSLAAKNHVSMPGRFTMLARSLTTLPGVREAAFTYLPWAALYVLVSVAAFQLDGVFIGTTRTREMRNAGVISLAVFLLAAWALAGSWGNHGLWMAFIIYVIARAGALWPYFRRMEAGLAA